MARLLGTILHGAGRAAVALAVLALLLGRSAREPRGDPRPGPRSPAFPRYHGISGGWFARDRATPRFCDAETGAVTPWAVPALAGVEPLGCSPWRDGAGQHHLAVFCRPLAASPAAPHRGDFTLARCTYPEGRVLGRIPLDGPPPARVCWAPDRSDRILFAATDGKLYSCDFPDGEGAGMPAPQPQQILWKCDPPGRCGVYHTDPCWPAAPDLGGRIFVALVAWDDASRQDRGSQIWWLQLAPDGAEIAAAGRAIDPRSDGPTLGRDSERLPAVGATRDGRAWLAYLARGRGQSTWELWVTPIAADGADQAPRALPLGCKLAEECLAVTPVFSPDGRWIYVAMRDERDGIRMERFEVASRASPERPSSGFRDGPKAVHAPPLPNNNLDGRRRVAFQPVVDEEECRFPLLP